MITGGLTALTGMTGTFTTDYTKATVGDAKAGIARIGSGGMIAGSISGSNEMSGSITLVDTFRGEIGGE